jgi:hypothetical protein
MPRAKRNPAQVLEIRSAELVDAAQRTSEMVDRVARLERGMAALATKLLHGGLGLQGCTRCRRYAERQVVVSSPTSGAKYQDLCGRCEPHSPIIGMKGVSITEVPLSQAAKAREANADLDILLGEEP